MKKAIVIMLTGAMMVAAVACGGGSTTSTPAAETQTEEAAPAEESEEVESTVDESAAEEVVISEDAMTYEAYAAAAVDTEVVVEGGVQAKQSYYADNGTANVYLQDETGGAYFLYNLPCTQKEYDLLKVGSKIKVKGYKAEWSGEVEVIDAIWMFVDGEYIAEPEDVTELLGTDELINKQNKKVVFKGMTVEPIGEDGTAAFLYNWDGSGSEDDDLYFNVSYNGQTYNFTVESYLCGPDTDVYKAVKELQIGSVIDMEGFLYWYEGPNPHITAVTVQ